MDKARIGKNGPLVTVSQFLAKAGPNYKEREIFPYCPACDERVEVYGAHSLNVTSRFHHPDRAKDADPLDDCHLANRNDSRFQALQPSRWDYEQAQRIKRCFCEPKNIAMAYNFMLQLCRRGNLPVGSFHKCLERADKKGIWAYTDIPLWVIPYILLTLCQFKSSTYAFHFVFDKPLKSHADVLWKTNSCFLNKVFSSSGDLVQTSDNPFPVTLRSYLDKGRNVEWIQDHLLRSLVPLH